MAIQTRYLGLTSPTTTSQFSTADLAANWDKIDKAPGTFICTSSTRPTWSAQQVGRRIYETDTDLEWIWSGSGEWRRSAPKGLLKTTGGGWASGTRDTDLVTTSTTSVLVASIASVVVPAGRRTLQITVSYSRAFNSSGYFYGRLYRHAGAPASNSGTMIHQWAITGANRSGQNPDEGGGGFMASFERDGVNPGVYGWSFQVSASPIIGGTTTVQSNPTTPAVITVSEV